MTDGTVRVQGDGSLGIKVGLGMLLCLLPGLGLYSVFGERHFLGILGACMGGLLALLAPIPLVVGTRLSRHSIALAPDGTLRVTTDKRSAVFRLDALEALILAEGARAQDKTLKLYPGFYHETMNEPLADRRQVLSDVVAWINAHS